MSLLVVFVLTFPACEPPEVIEEEDTMVYLSEVFEYVYGPGQHAAQAKSTDTQFIIGNPAKHSGWLYLGGFGGYVVAGFSANIPNLEGADFEVFALPGAGPEPAVVSVMSDDNNDGLPNETWYELKGSRFENSQRKYTVTYYKALSDTVNITWSDSESNTGELKAGFGPTPGKAYTSTWWWSETLTDIVAFEGTRLPDAYEYNQVGETSSWTVPEGRFEWGYAENKSGTDYDSKNHSNRLDISNAVDANGNPVHLDHIRFIKIQSAVLQQAGWLNEVSPEIRGAGGL